MTWGRCGAALLNNSAGPESPEPKLGRSDRDAKPLLPVKRVTLWKLKSRGIFEDDIWVRSAMRVARNVWICLCSAWNFSTGPILYSPDSGMFCIINEISRCVLLHVIVEFQSLMVVLRATPMPILAHADANSRVNHQSLL